MTFFNIKIPSERLLRWLFIVVFWAIWLGLPFILTDEEDTRRRQFLFKIFPAMLANIPLFFLNTELLIPHIFRKRGILLYLLALLALSAVFIVLQGFMKSWLLAPDRFGVTEHIFRSVTYVLFIAAASTCYGVITYMVDQEKARQEEQKERMQSELSFLRSQISPHFIFNILNSIVYLIRSKSELAEPVTIKLSELMRYMLYESADAQVSLEKELDYLKNYVELQKIRFEEDVEIRMNMEGEADSQIIEPMLMIPFVENAFKHGVGLVASPKIDISLKISEKELFFTVKNKIAPESSSDKDSSAGIGLQNVKRRLELLYPDAHRLEIKRDNGWFEAHLYIRFRA